MCEELEYHYCCLRSACQSLLSWKGLCVSCLEAKKIKLVTNDRKVTTYKISCVKQKCYTIAPPLLLFAQMAL